LRRKIVGLETEENVHTNDLGPDYWAFIWGRLVAALHMGSLENLADSIQDLFIPEIRGMIERSELRRLKMEGGATGSTVLKGRTTVCRFCMQ
jgi:hypothetical protein